VSKLDEYWEEWKTRGYLGSDLTMIDQLIADNPKITFLAGAKWLAEEINQLQHDCRPDQPGKCLWAIDRKIREVLGE